MNDGLGAGVGVGGEVVSCGAGGVADGGVSSCLGDGVVLAVVVSSIITGGGVSWVGDGGTGTLGLQPSSVVETKSCGAGDRVGANQSWPDV